MSCSEKSGFTKVLRTAAWRAALAVVCGLLVFCALTGGQSQAFASFGGLEDGTYVLDELSCDTGMVNVDPKDLPGQVVVGKDEAWLVVPVYNPNKYDAIWKGKRAEAPDDPRNAEGLVEGCFVEMDDAYAASGELAGQSYTEDTTNVTYKAVTFALPLTETDLKAGQVQFAIRRASWSPSNPGQWMGSSDHYFTFSGPTLKSSSTDLPVATHLAFGRTRRLISALSADPYDITADDGQKVEKAGSAYDLLSTADQAALDEEVCASSQSYGRVLEAARWRIASFTAVDNSTTLKDGTYTASVMAASDMGKSTSARARTWSIDRLSVSGGKAVALITWSGSTPLGSLQLGGATYENKGSGSTSSFEIPVDLNADMYFAVKIRDAVESTTAIAYHFVATLDESAAIADSAKTADAADPSSSSSSSANGDSSSDPSSGTSSSASQAKPSTPSSGSKPSSGSSTKNTKSATNAKSTKSANSTANDSKSSTNAKSTTKNSETSSKTSKSSSKTEKSSGATADSSSSTSSKSDSSSKSTSSSAGSSDASPSGGASGSSPSAGSSSASQSDSGRSSSDSSKSADSAASSGSSPTSSGPSSVSPSQSASDLRGSSSHDAPRNSGSSSDSQRNGASSASHTASGVSSGVSAAASASGSRGGSAAAGVSPKADGSAVSSSKDKTRSVAQGAVAEDVSVIAASPLVDEPSSETVLALVVVLCVAAAASGIVFAVRFMKEEGKWS